MISVTSIPAFIYSALLFLDRLKMMPSIKLTEETSVVLLQNEPAFRLYVGLDNTGCKDVTLYSRANVQTLGDYKKYVVSPLWYGLGAESDKGRVILKAGSTAIDIAWRRLVEQDKQFLNGIFKVKLEAHANGARAIKKFVVYIGNTKDPKQIRVDFPKLFGRKKALHFCDKCYMGYSIYETSCPYCKGKQGRPVWWVREWTPLRMKSQAVEEKVNLTIATLSFKIS